MSRPLLLRKSSYQQCFSLFVVTEFSLFKIKKILFIFSFFVLSINFINIYIHVWKMKNFHVAHAKPSFFLLESNNSNIVNSSRKTIRHKYTTTKQKIIQIYGFEEKNTRYLCMCVCACVPGFYCIFRCIFRFTIKRAQAHRCATYRYSENFSHRRCCCSYPHFIFIRATLASCAECVLFFFYYVRKVLMLF